MKVDLPMPPSRCRRGWMLWYLWGLLGTALTLEGTTVESLDGAALPMAFWLSSLLGALCGLALHVGLEPSPRPASLG